MPTPGYDTFSSIPALKAAYSGYFFSKDTMRWFRSKIETGILAGRFFITSEHRESMGEDDPTERLYTIREAVRQPDGTLTIETVGEFQQYKTLADARQGLKDLAPRSK